MLTNKQVTSPPKKAIEKKKICVCPLILKQMIIQKLFSKLHRKGY